MNIKDFYPLFQKSDKVVIDSRKIEKNDLFFAFSGDNFDAAEMAENAVQKGALAVIVENKNFENTEKNIFYVNSTLQFLQDLALYHRNQLKISVIGLTGSNGKTTTKELIHAVLSQKFNVQCTVGNLNNHIGVPLTILSIKTEHEIAVVEMGANHQKEIAFLSELAKPNIGYITNFGKAHLEGFGGFEGVIKGKSELYDYLKTNNQIILVNENDAMQVEKTHNYGKKISFGKENSDYSFSAFTKDNFVGLKYKDEQAPSHLTGNYNFTNLSAAAALGFHFGLTFENIRKAFDDYLPTNMRSQILQKEGKTFVLDTYNANPSSMAESLKNFNDFKGEKTVIIGDMLELGDESEVEHQNILELAKNLNFHEIITVGKHFKNVNLNGKSFLNTEELIEYLKEKKMETPTILLKGSRGIALEKIMDFM